MKINAVQYAVLQPFPTVGMNVLGNDMIQIGVGVDSKSESLHYKQFLSNSICNNVCFNQPPESEELEEVAGTSAPDLLVDKHMENGERLVVAIQRVNKFDLYDIFIGVLVIGVKTNTRWFVIDQSVIKKRSKVK